MSVRVIAARAGISASAVSLALRGSPKVSSATRETVLRIARELGYQPDAKVTELMARVRATRPRRLDACFGVISLYDEPRPWEKSRHLTGIYDGMQGRAAELGYRLEPLWLRAPGMTRRRFRSILDARGIEGLLSFGSPDPEETFPRELDHYAIVTVGMSIRTPLHRVMSHFYNDTRQALDQVHGRGYRRPGLVLAEHEATRSGYAHASAYLGWCDQVLGPGSALPVLHMRRVEEAPLLRWIERHRADVITVVHLYDVMAEFIATLARNGIRAPRDLGLAAVTQILDGSGLAGMQQNQHLMGAWAVELLVSRLLNQDLGIPQNPRIELVESEWHDGASLAQRASKPPASAAHCA
ncbi:MAG TPA: LacI family DNA-binding transcriptional regulator [Opitutaceae bacterium]